MHSIVLLLALVSMSASASAGELTCLLFKNVPRTSQSDATRTLVDRQVIDAPVAAFANYGFRGDEVYGYATYYAGPDGLGRITMLVEHKTTRERGTFSSARIELKSATAVAEIESDGSSFDLTCSW